MTPAHLNLSTRPFVNARPVVRLSLLLWLVGVLLMAGNLWLYWDFLVGRGDVDARRREAGEAIAVEQRRIEALTSELAGYDLGAQNEQVGYLNQRIRQRRFSWSRLFDELADLLPRDVRLNRLQPSSDGEGSGGSRSRSRRGSSLSLAGGQVLLDIEGRARTDGAILELVDALFADPDFDRPNLIQQAQEQGGLIRFNLQVFYHPRQSDEPEILPLEEATEEGGAEESALGPEESERVVPRTGDRRPVALGRPASATRELS